jgi:hypothetical protein
MIKLKTGLSFLALIGMLTQGRAAELCDMGSAAALKTAAVQQELMVAGLTCHADAQYNRFVLANRPELQLSDSALMNYFRQRDGNEAGYDSYKTKLANLAANKSSAPGNSFCNATARAFQASQDVPLDDFIAGQHLLIAAPESCAVKYDRVEEAAVAGPSYALPPAVPYGAPYGAPNLAATLPNTPPAQTAPPTARRYADLDQRQDYYAPASPPPPAAQRYPQLDQRQAYNAPSRQAQRTRQLQQEYLDDGWVYDGTYGWVPPRPPRRGGWYGYDD